MALPLPFDSLAPLTLGKAPPGTTDLFQYSGAILHHHGQCLIAEADVGPEQLQ